MKDAELTGMKIRTLHLKKASTATGKKREVKKSQR
jgi:hypothetical protein